MIRYAEKTRVSVAASQAELSALLKKHGAKAQAFAVADGMAAFVFELEGRRVKLQLTAPTEEQLYEAQRRAQKPVHGWKSWNEQQRRGWAEEEADTQLKQRWRAFVLVAKAKLELIADGMSTIEREFLADIVLPSGERVGDWLGPQLQHAYLNGAMPPLLPGVSP